MKKNRPGKISQIIYLLGFAIKSRFSHNYKKPLLCGFKITSNCNLKCVHCPFWQIKEFNQSRKKTVRCKEMNFTQVKENLDQLYNAGVRIVIFEGGEPLLWQDKILKKDLNDVISYAKELFFFVGITTNGTIDLGRIYPDLIFISIDGLKKTHDSIRGRSFDAIMKNLQKHSKTKKIIANICISKINYEEIPELIKFLNDRVYGMTIQFFYPYEELEDLKLDGKQKELVLNKLLKLKKQKYRILDSGACLSRMAYNTWNCCDFLVSSVELNGTISYGCYLKNKVPVVSCKECGFAAHCEISLAYNFNIPALKAASDIFW